MSEQENNNKEILIVPAEPYLKGELFNAGNKHLNRDGTLEPGIALRNALRDKGSALKTVDMGDVDQAAWIIFCDTPPNNRYLKQCLAKKLNQKMILMVWEPPVVSPVLYDRKYHALFRYVLTWDDDLVDNKKYFKLYWPQPEYKKKVEIVPFAKKKMLTLIAGDKYSLHPKELYSERVRAINYFSRAIPNDFDFYGMGWGKKKLVFSRHPIKFIKLLQRYLSYPAMGSYKGVVEDKIQTLSKYKFCICYENMRDIKGFITEKIFDCFKAGCVPIYWGASNVQYEIPSNVYIDRREYSSYQNMLNYIKTITEDQYLASLSDIARYCQGKKYEKYLVDSYVKTIISLLGLH